MTENLHLKEQMAAKSNNIRLNSGGSYLYVYYSETLRQEECKLFKLINIERTNAFIVLATYALEFCRCKIGEAADENRYISDKKYSHKIHNGELRRLVNEI